MRTPRLFLGIFALALLLPLMLMACGGSNEPTNEPSSKRATAEPATPAAPATVPPTATDAPAAPAASGSAETDREALVALYNATDGENWDESENWLSDAPLGEWEGVTTNDDGRVTKLELRANALSGDTAGAGQPIQPDKVELHRQRLERGDTAGAGQPPLPDIREN